MYAARFGRGVDTADPISKTGGASVKTHLRKGCKHHGGKEKSEKQQRKHQSQKRGGGCCMVPDQIFHCSPWRTHVEQRKGARRKKWQRGTALYCNPTSPHASRERRGAGNEVEHRKGERKLF